MRCENLFCIYWKENGCTLEKISLDIQGICQDCVYATLDEALLEKERKNALLRYEGEF